MERATATLDSNDDLHNTMHAEHRNHWRDALRLILAIALCVLPAVGGAGAFQLAEDASDGLGASQLSEAFWLWQLFTFVAIVLVFPASVLRRFQLTMALCALYLFIGCVVRIDGFSGDRWPKLAWRWSASTVDPVEDLVDSPVAVTIGADDYPGFRGWNASGVVRNRQLAPIWHEKQMPRQVWTRNVGVAWSSFAVAGGICVTQEQRESSECVVAYQLTDGEPIWIHRDWVQFEEPMGGGGPRATPIIAAGRVVSLGATGLLTCLDAPTGNLIWQVDLVEGEEIPLRFGFSASPLVVEGRVFVTIGGKQRTLAAFDLDDGKQLWSRGDFPASYSTPQLWQSKTGKAILLFHGKGLSSFDFETGQIQWTHDWVTNPPELNNVCQPVLVPSKNRAQHLIFLSSGYGEGCALLEIAKEKRYTVRERWWNLRMKAKFTSVVLHAGYVYGLDNRKLVCLDPYTGTEKWRGGRFGYGQLMLVDRQLVIMAESGMVALVDATPEKYQLRGQFKGLPGRTWNHPALSANWLLIRNDRVATCWRLPRRTRQD